MAAKIIAALLTLLINVAAGVAVFFVMLLAMNGYNESDAAYGLGAYIVLAVAVTILMTAGAFLTAGYLIRKTFGSVAAVLIAVLVFSVFGAVLKAVCGLIGVGIAEFVRVNY